MKNLTICKLNKLNQAKRNGVRLRPARRGHALFILVLVLASLAGRTEIYAIDPTDTRYGTGALANVTSGISDSAFGYYALYTDTNGYDNTASGAFALTNNIDGNYNTANGHSALSGNTHGNDNTASGYVALYSNNTGSLNTATGVLALYSNTTGNNNTANGYLALISNRDGNANTASGAAALYYNIADNNTASGVNALYYNTNGHDNTASGVNALYYSNTGNYNTASGDTALYHNTYGGSNTPSGAYALFSNTTGSSNTALGTNAGYNLTIGSGNVCIGVNVLGVAGESNTTRIRNVYSSVASGRAVYVNSDNKIGTLVSSRRFKEEIKPMEKASEAILGLRPVSFRYKKEIEANGARMFGLIAEEVEKVDPELVTRNEKGEAETVRYDAVNAMLLNEFLKEHKTVLEQGAMIARQQKQIEALTAGLQKVSAQIEMGRPTSKVVLYRP